VIASDCLQEFLTGHTECSIVWASVNATWFPINATTKVARGCPLLDDWQAFALNQLENSHFLLSLGIDLGLRKPVHVDIPVWTVARA
jgi:hypothetical protein